LNLAPDVENRQNGKTEKMGLQLKSISASLIESVFIGLLAVFLSPLSAHADEAIRCEGLFANEPKTLKDVDQLMRELMRNSGRKVDEGIISVAGRKDWRVDYEFISGDPSQPLVVLLNGFIWPREHSAPMWTFLGGLPAVGGPSFNLLRYDMTGQGRTIALYEKGKTPPWYVKQPMSLADLRTELGAVIRESLKRNQLPENHPLILMGLSYGRALIDPTLREQVKMVVEIAPLIQSKDVYEPAGRGLRSYLNWLRLNPFMREYADQFQMQAWRSHFRDFYARNPQRIPEGVVKEWYQEASAARINATFDFHAKNHIIEGRTHLLFVAEIDDVNLKRDQLLYYRDHLSQKAPSVLVYVRNEAHGMTLSPEASNFIALAMANTLQRPDSKPGVYEAQIKGTQVSLKPTTVESLLKELK